MWIIFPKLLKEGIKDLCLVLSIHLEVTRISPGIKRNTVRYLSEHMTMVQNILSSNAFSILLDILAEEIQISFLEELHRIDAVKLRKDIVPQVAAAYYSGGVIQI